MINEDTLSLPTKKSFTVYKSFFIPHLDCGDIFYDKLDNEFFIKKEEKVQCKACLAITVVVVDVA